MWLPTHIYMFAEDMEVDHTFHLTNGFVEETFLSKAPAMARASSPSLLHACTSSFSAKAAAQCLISCNFGISETHREAVCVHLYLVLIR